MKVEYDNPWTPGEDRAFRRFDMLGGDRHAHRTPRDFDIDLAAAGREKLERLYAQDHGMLDRCGSLQFPVADEREATG